MPEIKHAPAKSRRMMFMLLALALLAIAAGIADAAKPSIQLNSSASFPVDI
ncbi:MAG: hypothetical protein Q9M16_10175 [Mariprofundus sp.]|nr:hypothetical protein [Mariprofundus sp.]